MDGWIRKGCRRCDCLFVHTERLADELSQFLDGVHPPIRVTPHGVWSAPADASQTIPLEERLSWKRLLFFGSIRRNKGLDLLLRAAESLPSEYAITVAGEPMDAAYFRDEVVPLIERLRATGRKVELIDRFLPDDQVEPLMALHSAVILPYTKGFVAQSGVVFLALAHGLPVVASSVGGLRDLFAECPVGTIFEDETPAALALAIQELFDRRDPRDVTAAMRDARQRFSWDESARATIEGYELVRRREAETANEGVMDASGCAI
jgi:glycosyltransferase involved in cell wall biosynthesis